MIRQTGITALRFVVAGIVLFGAMDARPAPAAPSSASSVAPADAEPAGISHEAYMAGYSDGTFKPDRPLSRAELASALARAVQREEIGSAPAFTDVEAGHWASSAIAKAYRMRLMAGEPGGAFEPNRAVTFRELTIVFGRLLGSETEALSIMNGRSASIHDEQVPQDAHGVHDEHIAVSRAEFVVWMNAMLRRRPLTDAPQQWIDVSADREEYEDIQEASISHLFEPTPDGSETWGESARRKDD